jgi:hypothetical protein
LVVIAIVAAVVFGLYIGYLAWTNDSFPSREEPFSNYAQVVSATYNGTEYAFRIQWISADYVPMFAQLTSPDSDSANTDVCGTGLNSVTAGQSIFMPFGLSSPATALSNVDLSVAVKSAVNGTEFTIVYHVESVTALQGDIQPQALACTQPSAPM